MEIELLHLFAIFILGEGAANFFIKVGRHMQMELLHFFNIFICVEGVGNFLWKRYIFIY